MNLGERRGTGSFWIPRSRNSETPQADGTTIATNKIRQRRLQPNSRKENGSALLWTPQHGHTAGPMSFVLWEKGNPLPRIEPVFVTVVIFLLRSRMGLSI